MSSTSKSTKTTPKVNYAMSQGQAVQGLYDYSTNTGILNLWMISLTMVCQRAWLIL